MMQKYNFAMMQKYIFVFCEILLSFKFINSRTVGALVKRVGSHFFHLNVSSNRNGFESPVAHFIQLQSQLCINGR